jgi:HK97 family phage major capsid protein
MQINVRELSRLTQEYDTLSRKMNHNPQEKRRFSFLPTAISSVKAGASVDRLEQDYVNDQLIERGLSRIQSVDPFVTSDQKIEARGWQNVLKYPQQEAEQRDMTEGSPVARLGTYSGLGNFVPTDFFPTLYAALGAHDPLFDEDAVTLIKTSNGRVLPMPVIGDIEVVAGIAGEAGSQSSVDFSSTGHAPLAVYTYNSKRVVISLEALQDVSGALSIIDIIKSIFASRLARGISADLLNGNGTGRPLGLLTTLSNLGLQPVVATGSAANTGGAESGANSLGTADFANAVAAMDSAYLESDKIMWMLNRKTLGYMNSLVSKQGTPLDFVKYVDGQPFILGLPVRISPSMPNIGASNTPVVLLDGTYWASRLVVDGEVGLQVYREGIGLIEKGNVGLGCFVRAGGVLLYNDVNSPAPAVVIQNHS